jgi:hypothetical protein
MSALTGKFALLIYLSISLIAWQVPIGLTRVSGTHDSRFALILWCTDLQKRGRESSLSWVVSWAGSANAKMFTCICKSSNFLHLFSCGTLT